MFTLCYRGFVLQVSLGTSDTLIMWITSAQPQLMGHVFVNPVDDSAFMAMLWLVHAVTVFCLMFCS